MNASDSEDDENVLVLDDEDIAFIEQDLETDIHENEIVLEDVICTSTNQTADNLNNKINVIDPTQLDITFKWKSNTRYNVPKYLY